MKNKYNDKDVFLLSELRQMEVIDIKEGKRLGFISDIIFDDNLENIESIVIPPQSGLLSFFKRKEEIIIKWHMIKTLGYDIVLVDIDVDKNDNDEDTDIEESL